MLFWSSKNRAIKKVKKIDLDEIKLRSRILIIDNERFEYQDLFGKEGYQITKWTNNDEIDQNKIDAGLFDIILLDIDGVATDRSDKHGLGLLEYIKTKNPAQVVILYSAQSFDMEAHKYIKLADESLKKSANYFDFKKTVDHFLQNRLTVTYYLLLIKKIIATEDISIDVDSFIKEALEKKDIKSLKSLLEDLNLAGDLIEKAVIVGTIAFKVLG